MKKKLMYTVGNLHSGNVWGVKTEQAFGISEIHGPFGSENDANNYAHDLVQDQPVSDPGGNPFTTVMVVRIETPQAGTRIVRGKGAYRYAV